MDVTNKVTNYLIVFLIVLHFHRIFILQSVDNIIKIELMLVVMIDKHLCNISLC